MKGVDFGVGDSGGDLVRSLELLDSSFFGGLGLRGLVGAFPGGRVQSVKFAPDASIVGGDEVGARVESPGDRSVREHELDDRTCHLVLHGVADEVAARHVKVLWNGDLLDVAEDVFGRRLTGDMGHSLADSDDDDSSC